MIARTLWISLFLLAVPTAMQAAPVTGNGKAQSSNAAKQAVKSGAATHSEEPMGAYGQAESAGSIQKPADNKAVPKPKQPRK